MKTTVTAFLLTAVAAIALAGCQTATNTYDISVRMNLVTAARDFN